MEPLMAETLREAKAKTDAGHRGSLRIVLKNGVQFESVIVREVSDCGAISSALVKVEYLHGGRQVVISVYEIAAISLAVDKWAGTQVPAAT